MYEDAFATRNSMNDPSVNPYINSRGTLYRFYPPRFQPAMDFEIMKTMVHELYWPTLRLVGLS